MGELGSIIPVVDCSAINGTFEEISEGNYGQVAEELGNAMSGVGFAYLINHGVNLQKLANVQRVAKEFFTLPKAVKQNYCKSDAIESFHGYTPSGIEVHDVGKNSVELREAFDIYGPDALDDMKYPQEIVGFKEAFDSIRLDLNILGRKVLKCYGKYLKLEDEGYLLKHHTHLDDPTVNTQTQFRSLYYYPLEYDDNCGTKIPQDAIRLGEHSDWGSITFLFQDNVGGLEIKTCNGEWIQATPVEDVIILNNGNLMEFWTAGIFHAAIHRVNIPKSTCQTKPRQSFVHFITPDDDTQVSPIVEIPPGNVEFLAKSPVITSEYLKDKYKALVKY